jgi:hypothetical protein
VLSADDPLAQKIENQSISSVTRLGWMKPQIQIAINRCETKIMRSQ